MKLDFKKWLNEAAGNFRPQPVRTPNFRDIRVAHGPGSRFNQSVPSLPKRIGSDIMTGHGASMQHVFNKYGGAPEDGSGYRDYFGDAFNAHEKDGVLHFYSKFNIDPNDSDQIEAAKENALQNIANNPRALAKIQSSNTNIQAAQQDYFQDQDDGALIIDTFFRINKATSTKKLQTKAI